MIMSRLHEDINGSAYRLRRVFCQNEGRRQIYGLPDCSEARGTRDRKTQGWLRHRLSRDRKVRQHHKNK